MNKNKIKITTYALLTNIFLVPVFALNVQGVFKQGGYLYGYTNVQNQIVINGENIPIGQDGLFVFGIDRNAKAELVVTEKQGVQKNKQTLIVEPRTYKSQALKNLPKRKVTPNAEDMVQITADKKQILAARKHFNDEKWFLDTFILPIKDENKVMTSVYGSRRTYNGEERSWHKGVDFAVPTGTPVYAPIDGVVALALPNSFFNGNLVILDHGHQLFSIYAHLDSMAVETGQKIEQGQKLGEVGTTGRSTGPHLHWGIYWRNIALDPMLFVNR